MNIEKDPFVYERAKELIEKETDISFFYGKLGGSISLMHFASKFNLESIYDFSLEQFNICFEKLKNTNYSNYDFDLSMFGIIIENLKQDDVLEVDTDYVLKDADTYVISSCSNRPFDIINYKRVLSYCFYISSRFKNKKIVEDNFFNYQILILKLIEISCKIDDISLKTKISAGDIELLFNIHILSKFLIRKKICVGLSENISERVIEIIKNYKRKLNFYENTLVSFLKNDYSEFLSLLYNSSDIISIIKKHKASKSQLFTLISFLKSPYVSNEEIWKGIKDKVLFLLEKEIMKNDYNIDVSILHGWSAFYYFSMNFDECDYSYLFSLNDLLTSKYPK